jgi:hypothetical protein
MSPAGCDRRRSGRVAFNAAVRQTASGVWGRSGQAKLEYCCLLSRSLAPDRSRGCQRSRVASAHVESDALPRELICCLRRQLGFRGRSWCARCGPAPLITPQSPRPDGDLRPLRGSAIRRVNCPNNYHMLCELMSLLIGAPVISF